MLALMPYLASPPTVAVKSLSMAGTRTRSEVSLEIAYGFSSTLVDAGGRSRPIRVAAAEARKMLVTPPVDAGTKVRCVHSFLRRIERRICSPHSRSAPET